MSQSCPGNICVSIERGKENAKRLHRHQVFVDLRLCPKWCLITANRRQTLGSNTLQLVAQPGERNSDEEYGDKLVQSPCALVLCTQQQLPGGIPKGSRTLIDTSPARIFFTPQGYSSFRTVRRVQTISSARVELCFAIAQNCFAVVSIVLKRGYSELVFLGKHTNVSLNAGPGAPKMLTPADRCYPPVMVRNSPFRKDFLFRNCSHRLRAGSPRRSLPHGLRPPCPPFRPTDRIPR